MAALRICFIGDSLIAGTGDAEFLGWPGRICAAARARGHDLTCYNLGIRGNTGADILKRWRPEAEARVVAGEDCGLVFEFGVNDTRDVDGRRAFEPPQAIARAREILANAGAWLPTLMIGPPPIADAARNQRIADMSGRLAALCGEIGVPYFGTFDALTDSSAWRDAVRAGDGIHPVAAGYVEWTRVIEAWPEWRGWTP